jgi:hypothetical protein
VISRRVQQLVDITLKFYASEADPAVVDAILAAIAGALSVDNTRTLVEDDDDVVLISAGRRGSG